MSRGSRSESVGVLALILCVAGLLLWGGLTRGLGWGDDFAAYIMQAESIVQGNPAGFLEANRFTIEVSTFPVGPVAYPWGYPLLLAPVVAVSGTDVLALKSVGAVCYLLFLALLWFGFRRHHTAFGRTVLVCLFAFNPVMLDYVNDIASDLPFLLLSTLSVLLIGRLIVRGRRLTSETGDHLLLGFAIALAFLIRTNGILLLGTLAVAQAVAHFQGGSPSGDGPGSRTASDGRDGTHRSDTGGRRFRLVALPYAVFAAVVLAAEALLPGDAASHLSLMQSTTPGLILRQLFDYCRQPAHFFDGLPFGFIVFVYGLTVLLACVGTVRRRRSDFHVIVYAISIVLLYSIWPYWQGLRFLFPVLPFLFSFALTGLEGRQGVQAVYGRSRRHTLRLLIVLGVVAWSGVQSARASIDNYTGGREVSSGPYAQTSREMFSFIRDNTEAGSTVVFFKPRAMRLLTGRRTLVINDTSQLARADYLCIYLRPDAKNQVSHEDVGSLRRENIIELVYSNADFDVYRLHVARPAGPPRL